MQRVRELIGLQKRQAQELFGGRLGKRLVLLHAERGKSMPGLRRDDDTGSATGDDASTFLQHQRRAIQIH